MKTTNFGSVAEAAAQLAEDQSMAAKVQQEIAHNALVTALLTMRIGKGLTQEQVAQSMGCDPSKVSRLESGNDRQLKWLDIIAYARALRVDMSVIFDDSGLPAAERIKQCVFRIDDDLKKLAALAQKIGGEDEITREIDRFYKQVLFNFLVRFKQNSEKLSDVIRISGQPQQARLPEQSGPDRSAPPECAPAEPARH
jgi:transcriptional regulator with XRE-family HTH domain